MSFDTRATAAAEGLLAATAVDTEAGLSRIRRTHRRRTATRAAAAVLTVGGIVGVALAYDGSERATGPVDRTPSGNSGIVHADPGPLGVWDPEEVDSLPAPGTEPYPAWTAFDQDSSRFLYMAAGITGFPGDGRVIRVLGAGSDSPEVTILCETQCWTPSFGPGPDEVTAMVESEADGSGNPFLAQVMGFDGSLRDEIDLSAVTQRQGSGLADIAWSPDGTLLAVSTFAGKYEADCDDPKCTARVWLVPRGGGEPVLLHEQDAEPEAHIDVSLNPPYLHDLAWSPDGGRLAWVSSTNYPDRAATAGFLPTLVAIDVESGRERTLHEFADCGPCVPYNPMAMYEASPAFAWSPDGTRIAVTSGEGVAELSSSGELLVPAEGTGRGPLAWLQESAD